MNKMDRELFIESIEQLRLQDELDERKSRLLSQVFPNAFEPNLLYDNHYIKNQLLKVFQVLLNESYPDSWIEYFIFDLDYGRNFRMGMVTRDDGTNVDLSDAGKLYDFLMEEKGERSNNGKGITEDVEFRQGEND